MGAPLPGIRIGLLLVLVACNTAGAAKYGETCSLDTDCEEKRAPHCQVFFEDKSYEHNDIDVYEEYTAELNKLDKVSKRQGVCVECNRDCDCGVNEYCGYDYEVTIPYSITSTNEGNGMPASVKRRLELHSKQFAGVPIISKCKKYSTSHMKGKLCASNIDTGAFAKMVTESLLSADSEDQLFRTCNFKDSSGKKKTTVKRTPDYWPKDAQDRFCGRIVSWGPKFHGVEVLGEDVGSLMITNSEFQMSGDMSTHDYYDDVARCVPRVIAKDPVTCPSCLHSSTDAVGQLLELMTDEDFAELSRMTPVQQLNFMNTLLQRYRIDLGCFNHRQDARVCCTTSDQFAAPATRSCHDPSSNSVNYGQYNTCESACNRDGYSPPDYYSDCKDPASGQAKPLMTNTPTSDDEANRKTWCECVQTCIQCTGSNGGIGERPTTVANLHYEYYGIHGSCAPPPASWERPVPDSTGSTPSPPSTFEPTAFICASGTSQEECHVEERPALTTCKPSCVDCLVKAMQHGPGCPDGPTGKCPMTKTHMVVWESCETDGFYFSDAFYVFDINSPAVEWGGACQEGDCKACKDTDTRCDSRRDGGRPQICVNGEWTLSTQTMAFSMAKSVESWLIAITVIICCCFLALLGVLAAVCMLKQQKSAKSGSPGAAGSEEATEMQAQTGFSAPVQSGLAAPAALEETERQRQRLRAEELRETERSAVSRGDYDAAQAAKMQREAILSSVQTCANCNKRREGASLNAAFCNGC